MKLLAVVLALSCVIAYANAGLPRNRAPPRSTGPVLPQYPRFRREADPQDITANAANDKDTQVSIDTSSDNSDTEDRFRQKREARHAKPHIRFELEKRLGKNGFVTGFTDLQSGARGRGIQPTFGATGGFRFRRAAEPQRNTINFQGSQPLSGPDRRPTWDLNYNRNLLNNGRTTADLYGGLSKVPGQRVQPHIGIQAERNFGKNGFLRGSGQLQPGPGGRGLSPSVGVTGGFRFRREAEDADDIEFTEEY